MQTALVAARVLLIVIFAVAAFEKVRSRGALVEFVDSFRGLGYPASVAAIPLAVSIVSLEVLSIAFLATSETISIGFGISVLTLSSLAGGVALVIRSDRQLKCRCFGAEGEVLSGRHLARNVLLLFVAALGLAGSFTSARHQFALGRPEITAAALGVLFGVLMTRWDDLAFLVFGRSNHEHVRGLGVHR